MSVSKITRTVVPEKQCNKCFYYSPTSDLVKLATWQGLCTFRGDKRTLVIVEFDETCAEQDVWDENGADLGNSAPGNDGDDSQKALSGLIVTKTK